jgi:uncharacterized delta-60 repeat protein
VTTKNSGFTQGISSAVLQLDGKIVASGGSDLRRYNSDGSLDTTFGVKGVVTLPAGYNGGGVVIQPVNGSEDIVVSAGSANGSALLRYTPSGALDSTFGTGGEVVTAIAGYVAVENGDVVIGGGSNGQLGVLARYTVSGSLDPTFGSGGIVTTQVTGIDDEIHSLLVQPNGQIVAVGGDGAWVLARYNVNGSLDSTFGSGGIVTRIITGGDEAVGSALQSNGQIVVAGWGLVQPYHLEVGVYNANGSPDTNFGSGGFVDQVFNSAAQATAVVVQPDGKIVAVGDTIIGSKTDFFLARYGPSAAQIGSFTASPNPVTASSTVTLTASNLTLADPSSTIQQVAFYVQVNGVSTLLGYGTQTSSGIWTFSYTVNLAPGSYTLIAQAEDRDGVFGDPNALAFTVQ